MQAFFEELARSLEAGETVALTTIVKRRGSVPREIGAKMIVHADGTITGSVGGGCGEAEVWRTALTVIETGQPQTVFVDLTEEIAMTSEGVCGGTFAVFVQPWSNDPHKAALRRPMAEYARIIAATLQARLGIVLATVIHATGAWRAYIGAQMLIREDGAILGDALPIAPSATAWRKDKEQLTSILTAASEAITTETPRTISCGEMNSPAQAPEGAAEIFLDPFLPPPTLVIVGGGHIAVPLAQIASILGFSVVVTDNRPSFASKARFPSAEEIIVGDPEAVLRAYRVTPHTHFVLVTRAHSHDVQALRAIVDSPAAYIGMIGSQRRVWAVFKLLHDEGYTAEKLARVRAPIGLDLQGESPAEIALAIMAEIVMLRHGGTGAPMSDRLRERFMARLHHLAEQEGADDFS
jgi:xanthine dehydrogenase accessory factor